MRNKKILIVLPLVLLLSACAKEEPKTNTSPMNSMSTITSNQEADLITCSPDNHGVGNGTIKSIDGLTLNLASSGFKSNVESTLTLQVKDKSGKALSDLSIVHTKPMHLILVKKDLNGYLHLHPVVDENGNWSTPVTFPSGGEWQVIADVQTIEGKTYNLGTFINVKGATESFTLPTPNDKISIDGIDISISGMINPDTHGMLMLTASKGGNPITIEPYLGANAHLVAIKTDGSYAHMHPHSIKSMDACPEGEMPVNDPYAQEDAAMGMMHFMTEVPGAGTYRFFLQFQYEGVVHTGMFTAEVN